MKKESPQYSAVTGCAVSLVSWILVEVIVNTVQVLTLKLEASLAINKQLRD